MTRVSSGGAVAERRRGSILWFLYITPAFFSRGQVQLQPCATPPFTAHSARAKRIPFIIPSVPVLRQSPPSGPAWRHEIKFDGWRGQFHKDGDQTVVFSRNGRDLSRRFPTIRDSMLCLPARSAIIDAELVACNTEGMPDFRALMAGAKNVCAWCFDLMELDGIDLRPQPLAERRVRLRHLLMKADEDRLRYSDDFGDPVKLLKVADEMRLEGIVSKRADQPYRSGKTLGWVKVKCASWREANRERYKTFEKA